MITFTHEFKDEYSNVPSSKLVLETNAVTIHEVFEDFCNFLAGAGYSPKLIAELRGEHDDLVSVTE